MVLKSHFLGNGAVCSATVGRAPQQLPNLGNNWANIMMDNTFPCAGWLISVDYFRAVREGTAYFGVWRAVGELEFVLKFKLALSPNSVARHRVFADVPFKIARGDTIGIHYSINAPFNRRRPDMRSAIIPYARSGDPGIPETELHSTYNVEIFDEDIPLNSPVAMKGMNGGIVRSTFAVRANVVYEEPPGTLFVPLRVFVTEQLPSFSGYVIPSSAETDLHTEIFGPPPKVLAPTMENPGSAPATHPWF